MYINQQEKPNFGAWVRDLGTKREIRMTPTISS